MTLAWLVVALMAILGAPLFVLILAIALLGFHAADYDLAIVAVEFNRLAGMPGLVAIPLFTLAGYVLSESQAPKRLLRVSDALLEWLPGGFAIVALVASALFTAFTGASGVTIVAMGALLYPALRHAGYDDRFNLGLITSSGSLGLLFAPSLPLILYGFVAAQLGTDPAVTVEDLFLAGILPGLLMIFLLSLYAVYKGRGMERLRKPFSVREVMAAVADARWELPLPIGLLAAIYGGLLAASEAAAVTAAYVIVVTLWVRREMTLTRLANVMAEAARMVGAILVILGAALALSNWLVDQEVPTRLFELIRAHVASPLAFLLLLNGFLLIVGMLLDIFAAIVILVPLLVPVAIGYGIHPVHLGILMLANLQLGYFTPPVGMNLFIASYRFKTPIAALVRASLPFFLILLLAVLLITYVPWLSLVWI
ncbi:MAG: TRAP transporter large permease subunit [Lysobacteraceae bacterium]